MTQVGGLLPSPPSSGFSEITTQTWDDWQPGRMEVSVKTSVGIPSKLRVLNTKTRTLRHNNSVRKPVTAIGWVSSVCCFDLRGSGHVPSLCYIQVKCGKIKFYRIQRACCNPPRPGILTGECLGGL